MAPTLNMGPAHVAPATACYALQDRREALLLVGAKLSQLTVPPALRGLIKEVPGLPYQARRGRAGYL